jgi:hypothetical protein
MLTYAGMGGAKNIFWARLLQEEEDAWHCDTRLAADGLAGTKVLALLVQKYKY